MSEKKLRVGVIGTGIGKHHMRQYAKCERAELVAMCDADEKRLAEANDEFKLEHTFTDAQKMFESGLIDAVSVGTPNASHAPLTIAALKAGVHVLCEKPMAMNTGEALEMIRTAKQTGRKLGIHFNHRMNPQVHAMRRYVEAGELGDVYFARTFWHRRRGIPGRPGFVSKAYAGGGAMIDLGVHMLDSALYVMGHPKIKSLSAQVYTKFNKVDVPHLDMDVDDFAVSFVRFDTGATLEMEISWASHHDHPEQRLLQVYGTNGGLKRSIDSYGDGNAQFFTRKHGHFADTAILNPENVPTVQDDFVAACLDARDPLCSMEHGLMTMRILDALYESSATGKEVLFKDLPL
ncbi:MAG: Gfo/Idh/MocA family protein [Phycisphaerae bacterium]